MDNIEFSYLYRDGSNYKKWGRVIFSNPEQLTSGSVIKELRKSFLQDGLFIARQIQVQEVFLYASGKFLFDDHCYHEFNTIRSTTDVPNDMQDRSIGKFLIDVAREAMRGWQEFDPYDSEGSFGWLLARSSHDRSRVADVTFP